MSDDNITNGHLISFEGIDASGKSSQIPLLKTWLQEQNIHVITVREPGGTKLAEDIRTFILLRHHDIPEDSACLLFNAARVDLINKVIQPALKKGTWVIADRYTDSSHAYQHTSQNLVSSLETLLSYPVPSLTFFFDIPVDIAMQRNAIRGNLSNSIDNQNKNFHQKIHDVYHHIAAKPENRERFFILDAQKTIQDISFEIQKHTSSRLLSS